MQKILQYFLFLLVLVIFGTGIFYFRNMQNSNNSQKITNFKECEQAGFPIMESYPRQCLDSAGNHFTEELKGEEISESKKDLIVVDNIKDKTQISNPQKVTGKARGFWFFEGSFPIFVADWDGKIIGQGIATAKEEWMTEEFVDFEAEVKYELATSTPYKTGWLILQKENPSGMPENDETLEIPISFE